MKADELELWGNSIIERVKAERIQFREKPLEFSIFYSPLRFEPKLMLIGDNPGAPMEQPGLYEIPKIHEYVDPDPEKNYTIAKAMRENILKGEKLLAVLTNSVKLNRIFFSTPNLKLFKALDKANEMEEYCKAILDKIIETLKPKKILAESFRTFDALCGKGVSILDKPGTKKSLLILGNYNGVEVLGINHPSQAWRQGIGNADWELVNKELERRLE